MSNYKMNIKGQIGLSEYSNIHDYLGIVDKNDSFTIVFDNNNEHEINIINSMLKNNSFCIYDSGYDEYGYYKVIAYKI